MHWVGKKSDRVERGGSMVSASETRWIVPVKPYEAPRGSQERFENALLMGVAVAAIIFGFVFIIWSSL